MARPYPDLAKRAQFTALWNARTPCVEIARIMGYKNVNVVCARAYDYDLPQRHMRGGPRAGAGRSRKHPLPVATPAKQQAVSAPVATQERPPAWWRPIVQDRSRMMAGR